MIRSFINKLRDPDEAFVLRLRMLASILPISFGVLLIVVMLIAMSMGKYAEAGSITSQFLICFRPIILYLSFIVILGSSIGFRVLHYYAKSKLIKKG